MQSAAELCIRRIGSTEEAVLEGYDPEFGGWYGRTAADAPDVDGRVYLPETAQNDFCCGQYVTVRITDAADYDLIGEVVSDEFTE